MVGVCRACAEFAEGGGRVVAGAAVAVHSSRLVTTVPCTCGVYEVCTLVSRRVAQVPLLSVQAAPSAQ